MEKLTPHTKLSRIKTLIAEGKVSITVSAVTGAYLIDFDEKKIIRTVINLNSNDFYKSMTSNFDHKIWHDVYRPTVDGIDIYLKLIVSDGVLIVSFKEL